MKRFLLTSALVAFAAGSAIAQDESQLRTAVANELTQMGLNIDTDTLTEGQLSEIYLLTTNTDSGKRQAIEAALGHMGLMPDDMVEVEMPNTQLRSSVENSLTTLGIEANVSTLSDAQVAEIYLIANGSDMESGKTARIQTALGQMKPEGFDGTKHTMVVRMPENQLRVAVRNSLETLGLKADADALTQTQLAQIYLLTSNSSMDNNVAAQVEAIVN
ncbi:MAG: hypothetical protein WBN04_11215 [Paracoccaceae bacterium]